MKHKHVWFTPGPFSGVPVGPRVFSVTEECGRWTTDNYLWNPPSGGFCVYLYPPPPRPPSKLDVCVSAHHRCPPVHPVPPSCRPSLASFVGGRFDLRAVFCAMGSNAAVCVPQRGGGRSGDMPLELVNVVLQSTVQTLRWMDDCAGQSFLAWPGPLSAVIYSGI